MNKKYKVLCLNGINKGKDVLEECSYTEEEAQAIKDKMKIEIDGLLYAGYCRRCSNLVPIEKVEYQENVDGRGMLLIDVFHSYCL